MSNQRWLMGGAFGQSVQLSTQEAVDMSHRLCNFSLLSRRKIEKMNRTILTVVKKELNVSGRVWTLEEQTSVGTLTHLTSDQSARDFKPP